MEVAPPVLGDPPAEPSRHVDFEPMRAHRPLRHSEPDGHALVLVHSRVQSGASMFDEMQPATPNDVADASDAATSPHFDNRSDHRRSRSR